MNALAGRLAREQRTLDALIQVWCHERHGGAYLCAECVELRVYAEQRLRHCPFGADKPTCANCKVHCYKPEMRERVRVLMREAGPRLSLRHPILTFLHLFVDSRRAAPESPRSRGGRVGGSPAPGSA